MQCFSILATWRWAAFNCQDSHVSHPLAQVHLVCQVRHFFNQEALPKVTQALVISQLLPCTLPGDAGETTQKLPVIQNAVVPAATGAS